MVHNYNTPYRYVLLHSPTPSLCYVMFMLRTLPILYQLNLFHYIAISGFCFPKDTYDFIFIYLFISSLK